MLIDPDEFKAINDELGRSAGDALPAEVSRRLGRCTRPEHTVARSGGDEFTVMLEGVTDDSLPALVARRISGELESPFGLDGRRIKVAASIGSTVSGSGQELAGKLLRNAGSAAYRAKACAGTAHRFHLSGANSAERPGS